MRRYSKKYEYLVPQVAEYCKDINNRKKSLKLIGKRFGISADEVSSIIKVNKISFDGCKSHIIKLSELDKNDIHQKYLNGLNTVEIAAEYKVVPSRIYKILEAKNVKFRDNNFHTIKFKIDNDEKFDLKELLKYHNIKYKDYLKIDEIFKKYNIVYKITFKNEALLFKFVCPLCKMPSLKTPFSIKKEIFMCNECVTKNKSKFIAGKRISKNNTSGYIGVTIRKSNSGDIIGYKALISYKNKNLLNIVFKDETLSDKTLMEAAVHREKYIIENELPHTRNLSNEELISNMEMLGQYGDIGIIKKKLG